MVGKIMKGIAGFYYVHVPNQGIYECKARGVFRNKNIKPLVGDNVEIEVIDQDTLKGNVVEVQPRKNELIRPLVANIDQVMVVFAVTDPDPNYNLLDRFLIAIERESIDICICFNKVDALDKERIKEIITVYELAGYRVIQTSVQSKKGLEVLSSELQDKTTVFAGPSGVGKSSIFNELQDQVSMETGAISEKIKRGKHTTRHAELIQINETSYVVDTPGFSSIHFNDLQKEELGQYYIEFVQYEPYCKFQGCAHISEPNCGIKEAMEEGKISPVRYDNYRLIYEELKEQRRW